MKRRVERKYIDSWIAENSPNGMAKLALQAGVSTGLIGKAREGYAPRKAGSRLMFCRVLDIAEDVLFPILPDGEEQAS